MFNSPRIRTILLFSLVLIIAIVLRVYNLDSVPPGLYPDEAMNGNNAVEALEQHSFRVFYPENNGREGLFANIQALFIAVFGSGQPWVLRFVSALFGIGTVAGLFAFALALFRNQRIALAAAALSSFFLATSMWHIIFSRVGFRAIMAPFFLVWALYFFVRSVHPSYSNRWRSIVLSSALGGILYGLGMHSYIAYRITPLIIIIAFIAAWRLFSIPFRRIMVSFTVFVVFSLLVFSPLGYYFIEHPQDFFGRTAQISILDASSPLKELATNTVKTVGMLNVFGDYNWRHNYSGAPQLHWIVGIFFWIGVVMEFILLFRSTPLWGNFPSRERSFLAIVGFSWLIIGTAPVVFSSEGIPHALRAILLVPPIMVIAAMGAIALGTIITTYTRVRPAILRDSIVAIAIVLCVHSYIGIIIRWGQHPSVYESFNSSYVEIGREIAKTNTSLPKYVVLYAGGVDVRGIPMPAQTIMFLSDTFTQSGKERHNVTYILPDQEHLIPDNALVWYVQ